MSSIALTRMSSNGEVLIPKDIRKELRLRSGIQFVVLADKDSVIFKAITAPSMKDFDAIIEKARKQARRAGLKKSDIKNAVSSVRGNK